MNETNRLLLISTIFSSQVNTDDPEHADPPDSDSRTRVRPVRGSSVSGGRGREGKGRRVRTDEVIMN